MPKVKLFRTEDRYISEDDSIRVLSNGISDWEEISQEDLDFLIKNAEKSK